MSIELPTVVCDTREQAPWVPWISHGGKRLLLPVVRRKLDAGDYSIEGHEHEIAIERKSLNDWVGTMFGKSANGEPSWERFKREIERVKATGLQRFAVYVEASRDDVKLQSYRSQVKPASVLGRSDSLWPDHGIAVQWMGDRPEAERTAAWSLYRWWEGRRRLAQGSAA